VGCRAWVCVRVRSARGRSAEKRHRLAGGEVDFGVDVKVRGGDRATKTGLPGGRFNCTLDSVANLGAAAVPHTPFVNPYQYLAKHSPTAPPRTHSTSTPPPTSQQTLRLASPHSNSPFNAQWAGAVASVHHLPAWIQPGSVAAPKPIEGTKHAGPAVTWQQKLKMATKHTRNSVEVRQMPPGAGGVFWTALRVNPMRNRPAFVPAAPLPTLLRSLLTFSPAPQSRGRSPPPQ